MKKILKWVIGIIVIFWVIGWFATKDTKNDTTSKEQTSNAIFIQKSDFKEWPFTVDSGRIWCDDGLIMFSSEGILYGINGAGATFAKSKGGHDLKEIWAIDQKKKKELLDIGLVGKQSDAYMDMTPILNKGKSLCQ